MKLCRLSAMSLIALVCLADSGDRSKQVFTAIRSNDVAGLRKLVTGKDGANVRGDRDTPALMYACAFGSTDAVRFLLDAGADPNAKNAFSATPLMWATGDAEKVRLLLGHGADVNAKSKTGRTALMVAALRNGSDNVVDQLLAKGADPKAADESGMSFLMAAASAMNVRQVRRALELGADPNTKDATSVTPLMNAAGNGDVATVHLLISRGADVNAVSAAESSGKVKNGPIALGKFTPLILAASYGPASIVDELLRAGAQVNARDIRGMTPLLLAVSSEYQDPEIVRLLLKAGADPSIKSLEGESPADWALKFSKPESLRQFSGVAHARAEAVNLRDSNLSAKAAATESLGLLRKISGDFLNTGGCVSCHAQAMTGFAMSVAKEHGLPVTEAELKEQLPLAKGRWASAGDQLLLRFDPEGGADQIAYGALYLAAAGHTPDQMSDAMAINLMDQQLANGSWHSGGIARAPMEDSDISRTALSTRALQSFRWEGRSAEIAARIERAHQWLRRAKPVYNEESAMQLLGLKWAGDKNLSAMAHALAAQQREDGGWSQNPHLASDAYATGQTLYALRETGMSATDPVFRRGVRFLLATRREDGSWLVRSRAPKFQPYFQSGFPGGHDQWISMSATAWAVIALAMADEPAMTAGLMH